MFLALITTAGVSLISWLLFIFGRRLYTKGEVAGYLKGYKAARLEYRDVISKQKLRIIKLESDLRPPLIGGHEYAVDFNQVPVTMEHVKITKVHPVIHGLHPVEYQRLGETETLTGTARHVTLIVAESAQEC